jgi:hypothetical protein
MEDPCFIKKDSEPPACGVHHIAVEEGSIPIDPNAPHRGHITCLRCPVTKAIVDWPAPQS